MRKIVKENKTALQLMEIKKQVFKQFQESRDESLRLVLESLNKRIRFSLGE